MLLYSHMNRTTIMLPPALHTRAVRLARTRGLSLGGLIREALETQLAGWGKVAEDPLFAQRPPYAGPAPADLSEKHDDYLYGEEK